jgi:glycosyltransferase involved in cell wall biosynthesis
LSGTDALKTSEDQSSQIDPVGAPKPELTRPSVSFIVFALNEEARIEATVETVLRAIAESNLADYQIVLVNDGSVDKTGAVMDRMASQNSRICAVHNATNLGQGGAYKHGLTRATCDYVMGVAGDNAASVESIRSTIAPVGKADVVVPYANNPEARASIRRFGSRGFTAVINILFGLKIPYYNGAVPRREFLNRIVINTNGYAFFAEIVVKLLVQEGCSHVEVAVNYPASANAHTSALRIGNLVEVLTDVIRLFFEVRRPKTGAREVFINRSS